LAIFMTAARDRSPPGAADMVGSGGHSKPETDRVFVPQSLSLKVGMRSGRINQRFHCPNHGLRIEMFNGPLPQRLRRRRQIEPI
jgi:hypothetical protein